MLAAMLKDRERWTPKAGEGYNLMGIDDFERPGEQLYLIANYPTEEAANAAKAAYEQSSDDPVYVYGPDDE